MLSNPLLEMKDHVQQQLDAQAGHDVGAYLANLHRIVLTVEQQYGLTFRYELLPGAPETQPVIGKVRSHKRSISKRKLRVA
jgi:hypothetical protein